MAVPGLAETEVRSLWDLVAYKGFRATKYECLVAMNAEVRQRVSKDVFYTQPAPHQHT